MISTFNNDLRSYARGRRKLAIALMVALVAACGIAATAFAGTDTFCSNCSIPAYTDRTSQYDHHYTLVYTHDLYNTYKVGAGVWSCYGIAEAYAQVTHTYTTPCLSYAAYGNHDYTTIPANAHGNF